MFLTGNCFKWSSVSHTLKYDYADLRVFRLHYVTAGRGPAVVLLHGWPQTWFMWRDIIPGLAAHYRVIAPDLRGLGESSRPVGGYDKKTLSQDGWRLPHRLLRAGRVVAGRARLGRAGRLRARRAASRRRAPHGDLRRAGAGRRDAGNVQQPLASRPALGARLSGGAYRGPRGRLSRPLLPQLRRAARRDPGRGP